MSANYFDDAYDLAKSATILALDTETTAKSPRQAIMVGFSFSNGDKTFYIPVRHTALTSTIPNQSSSYWMPLMTEILSKTLIGHNSEYDTRVLAKEGFIANFKHDSMLLAYAMGLFQSIGLKQLVKQCLNHDMTNIDELISDSVTFDSIPTALATQYAEDDALQTYRLFEYLYPRADQLKVLNIYKLELALAPTVTIMENAGLPFASSFAKSEIARLQAAGSAIKEIYSELVGDLTHTSAAQAKISYPIGSTNAIRKLLFEVLGLSSLLATKAGAQSTSEDALQSYRGAHQIVNAILSSREVHARVNSYERLIRHTDLQTGRIHPRLNQTGASSGRFSSSDPNAQNLSQKNSWTVIGPKSTVEVTEALRSTLVAPVDHYLLECDFSQIEYRLVAGAAQCVHLLTQYRRHLDMHIGTYAFCFDIPRSQVTKDQRQQGKTINFALVYGMGPDHLYREMGGILTASQCEQVHRRYFEMIPEVVAFGARLTQAAVRNHQVQTYFGRNQYIHEFDSPRRDEQSKARRAPLNRFVQGTAADILKFAMVRVHNKILKNEPRIKMILTVHDSLLFEVHNSLDRVEAANLITTCMRTQLQGFPTLIASAKAGQTYGDLKDVDTLDDSVCEVPRHTVTITLPDVASAEQITALKSAIGNQTSESLHDVRLVLPSGKQLEMTTEESPQILVATAKSFGFTALIQRTEMVI